MFSKYSKNLVVILLLALAIRTVGLLWGVDFFNKPHFVSYHVDEPNIEIMVQDILDGRKNPGLNYPQGQPMQIALLSFPVKFFVDIDQTEIIFLGRLLSLIYGTLTVLVVFFLGRYLFKDDLKALLAALFLGLAPLHVTQSHYTMVDASSTFWLYLTILCSLKCLQSRLQRDYVMALIVGGIALSLKVNYIVLVPLIYTTYQLKSKRNWVSFPLLVILVFYIANGGHYTLQTFINTISNITNDNLFSRASYNKFHNPLIFTVGLIGGVGLPLTCCLLNGFRHMPWRNTQGNGRFVFLLYLPLVLYFLTICQLDVPFYRHILPIIPLACLIAAAGFNVKNPSTRRYLISFFVLYQLLAILPTELRFLHETRRTASQWIHNNIPRDKTVKLTKAAFMPNVEKNYQTEVGYDADYLVLTEIQTFRYTRSNFNFFEKYPALNTIFHGNKEDYEEFHKILRGQSNFQLVKDFTLNYFTPELWLHKKIWGNYPRYLVDIWIYKNSN